MGYKSIKDWIKERQEEYYSHVRKWVTDRIEEDRPLTAEEYSGMRVNSYERKLLHKIMDNKALITRIRYYMRQTGRELGEFELSSNYEDALLREFLPMLLERFEKLEAENDKLRKILTNIPPIGREEWLNLRKTT